MAKNNACLKEENLLTLLSLNNLIVPEIQREYVWGNNPDVLRKFLSELEEKAAPCKECHYVHTDETINVGFLYSYKPPYARVELERILDEYLIDGQQRITTLFLLLFYRATIEGRLSEFLSIIRYGEEESELAFNYKVRSLTQQFVKDFIAYAQKIGTPAFDFIMDQEDAPSWLLDDYKSDPTISSMLQSLGIISEVFGNTENRYYDFLLTHIHFWHFKTDVTSQGEELYITMNARGEQLVDNEMKKSRILAKSEVLDNENNWEIWQTFFWRNRKKAGANNKNADKGFNTFLNIIEGFMRFNSDKPLNVELTIDVIGRSVKALKHISSKDFHATVRNNYPDAYLWAEEMTNVIWGFINKEDTDWNIPNTVLWKNTDLNSSELMKRYNNMGGERNKSLLIWPLLYYYLILQDDDTPDDEVLIRLMRFYYVRYKCFKRSSTTISRVVNLLTASSDYKLQVAIDDADVDDDDTENGDSRLFSVEELRLFELYRKAGDDLKYVENALWRLQDLPYFIDGKDVGGDTIIDFIRTDYGKVDENNIVDSINHLYDAFGNVLPGSTEKDNILVKEILLFYESGGSPYWLRQSPWYYCNYETSSWKRIVRTPHFREFFSEIFVRIGQHDTEDINNNLDINKVLADFLEEKRKAFFSNLKDDELDIAKWDHRQLSILADIVADKPLWDNICGDYNIVFYPRETKTCYGNVDLMSGTRYCRNRYINLKPDWQKEIENNYGVRLFLFQSGSR